MREFTSVPLPSNNDLNGLISHLDARDFEDFVFEILEVSSPLYTLERERAFGTFRIDVFGEPIRGSEPQVRPIAFEIKKSAIVSPDLVLAQVGRRESMRRERLNCDFVLIIGGFLTPSARQMAKDHNLIIWDVEQLRSRITEDIWSRWSLLADNEERRWNQAEARTRREKRRADDKPDSGPLRADSLLDALSGIEAGETAALEYQRWVADAMEYLFTPPLGPVHYEDPDLEDRNRRDVILENWAGDGFWAQVRTIYSADQIVVDAKNSAKPLTKRPVVDIAHYLKPYGCGLFGILCLSSRCSSKCEPCD